MDPRSRMDPRARYAEHRMRERGGPPVDPREARNHPRGPPSSRQSRYRDRELLESMMTQHANQPEAQRQLYEYYLNRKNNDYPGRGGNPAEADRRRAAYEESRRREKMKRRPPYAPGEKQLIILRGFPGAGKTMLAKQITDRFGGHTLICSEDRYHWTGGDVGLGSFVFKPEINWQTRDWCAREVIDALRDGIPLVVVDNINYRIIHYEEHIRA